MYSVLLKHMYKNIHIIIFEPQARNESEILRKKQPLD